MIDALQGVPISGRIADAAETVVDIAVARRSVDAQAVVQQVDWPRRHRRNYRSLRTSRIQAPDQESEQGQDPQTTS